MRPPRHPAALAALSLPEALFRALVRLRNRRYDGGRGVSRAAVPVVSIGNLTVGGTGKTPFAAWLASTLRREGRRPAVVSRGYGGRAGRGPVVVSDGRGGPLVGAAVAGDEPLLLARTLDGVVVVVGSNRVAGAAAAARLGADCVLLDDGFQHRRLARDLDVVLLDATRPFGNGRLLPAGILREPVDSLGRAGAVVATRCPPEGPVPELPAAVARYCPGAVMATSEHRPSGFVDAFGAARPAPGLAWAFCGIAEPASFRSALGDVGVEVVAFTAFGDHHPYRNDEIAAIAARAGSRGAVPVTTEKDLARLGSSAPAGTLALAVETLVHEPGALLSAVRRALVAGGGR